MKIMAEKRTPNLAYLKEELTKVWFQEMHLEHITNLRDSMSNLKEAINNRG